MRVAVIDCGTNTVRLYIAEGDGADVRDLCRELRFVRLGEGVDASGRFRPEALARLFAALDEYASIIARAGVDRIRFVATSAARDAANREEFFAGVRSRLGVEAEVISGDEEAELSFLGALAGGPLPIAGASDASGGADRPGRSRSQPGAPDSGGPSDQPAAGPGGPGSVLVTDLGGGSTELIRGTAAGRVEAETSLNMGSVRLRERFLHHDPPLAGEVDQARGFVAGLLGESPVSLAGVAAWIGVAGTCTSLGGMKLGLTVYDRARVHDSVLAVADVERLSARLLGLTVAETLQAYPSLQPMRAEVICAGALICAELARRIDRPLVVRDTDILDGTAQKLMRS